MQESSSRYDILKVLHAQSGIIAAAGAGGKKTMLYRIACAHPVHVIITGTVKVNFSYPIPHVQAARGALYEAVARAVSQYKKFFFAQDSGTDKWLKSERCVLRACSGFGVFSLENQSLDVN